MRVGWYLGVLVVLGACGAEGMTSGQERTVTLSTITIASTVAPMATTGATSVPTTVAAPTTAPAPTAPITTGPGSAVGLDGVWQVTSGTVDGEPVQLIDGAPITFIVQGATLSGTASCNSYGFTFEVRDVGVEIVDGWVNEMGCEPAVTELEQLYLRSVGPIATFVVDDAALTWKTPNATWVFSRVPPTPDTLLIGTNWILNGVLYEFGGMSAMGIEAGRIVFADDGTITGSTSCRDISGTWILDGDTVNIADVTITGDCTGALAKVDEIVARVLNEGFSGSIDGNRLSARPSDNLGLDYFSQT